MKSFLIRVYLRASAAKLILKEPCEHNVRTALEVVSDLPIALSGWTRIPTAKDDGKTYQGNGADDANSGTCSYSK